MIQGLNQKDLKMHRIDEKHWLVQNASIPSFVFIVSEVELEGIVGKIYFHLGNRIYSKAFPLLSPEKIEKYYLEINKTSEKYKTDYEWVGEVEFHINNTGDLDQGVIFVVTGGSIPREVNTELRWINADVELRLNLKMYYGKIAIDKFQKIAQISDPDLVLR